MPAIYAHYCFGAKVMRKMQGEVKEIVKKYQTQFQIGLQGPDLLFFYKPFCYNKINQYGVHLHKISAYPFFEHALDVIREKGRNSREYAYLMGVVCHYILDSECHPYVSEMMEKTDVRHMEIEAEFEKKLLRMNRKDAFRYHLDKLVPTDRLTAEAICPFYENVKGKHVRESLRTMKLVKKLFRSPRALKRSVLNFLLKVSGNYKEYNGLIHQRQDNPKCRESNAGLQRRFDRAVAVAVGMIDSFDESVRTGKELDSRFDRTFE